MRKSHLHIAVAATCSLLTMNTWAEEDHQSTKAESHYAHSLAGVMEETAGASANTLTLGEFRFDPLMNEPQIPTGWESIDHSGADLRIIQFNGPIQQEWLDELEAAGIEIVQYIYPNSYIVWGTNQEMSLTSRSNAVRWIGDFAPAYRVQPRWQSLDQHDVDVRVMLYRGAHLDSAHAALAGLDAQLGQWKIVNDAFVIAEYSLTGSRFQEAAKIPGVYSIQVQATTGGLRGEMSNQVCVGNVDAQNRAFVGYQNWLNDVGLDGSGVIIANVDSGVQDNHPDLVNRLVSCTGSTCGGSSTSSHGTHTAGIMAADGSSGVTDSLGFIRGLGVAPGANLVEQVYYSYPDPNGLLNLMMESYANGASLSGNSWGPSGFPQGYDNDTYQVDVGVRDTDSGTPGSQPLTYVLSIMNGYGGTSSQGTPDEAKNIFTIGSTKMQNSNGSQDLNINDLSSNSAHGPALDGRKIPHMVAPGCRVDSTNSGSGYSLKCGTSMASPHVSGAIALFIEYYRNLPGFLNDPSPALVKAAFLPVCYDLAGYDDADGGTMGHPFDNKQGWGRMNIDAVVNSPEESVQYFDEPLLFDNTGEEWTTTFVPAETNEPIRMMLVWTDAPGHGLGGSTPAWNNDLDLVVEAGGNTYRGNNFGSDGYSTTGGSADFRNNTEGVFLQPQALDSITVRVQATNINSDGVPHLGDATDQDFALVIYNATTESDPCPADLTGDDQVNIDDVFAVLGLWGDCDDPCPPYCTADLTEDCTVEVDDIFAVLGQWGPCD